MLSGKTRVRIVSNRFRDYFINLKMGNACTAFSVDDLEKEQFCFSEVHSLKHSLKTLLFCNFLIVSMNRNRVWCSHEFLRELRRQAPLRKQLLLKMRQGRLRLPRRTPVIPRCVNGFVFVALTVPCRGAETGQGVEADLEGALPALQRLPGPGRQRFRRWA